MARKRGNSNGQSPQRDSEEAECGGNLKAAVRRAKKYQGQDVHPLVVEWAGSEAAKHLGRLVVSQISRPRGEKLPLPSSALPPIF